MSFISAFPVRDCLLFLSRGAGAVAERTENKIDDLLASMIADAANGTAVVAVIEQMLQGDSMTLPILDAETTEAVRMEISVGDIFTRLPEIVELVRTAAVIISVLFRKPNG